VACDGPPFGFPQRPYPLPLPRNPPLLFGVLVSDGASFLSSSEPRFLPLGGRPSLRLRGRRVEERPERRGVADRDGVAESRAGVTPSSPSSGSSSSSPFPPCSSSSSRGVGALDGGASAISSSELSDKLGIGVPRTVSANLYMNTRNTDAVRLRRPAQLISASAPSSRLLLIVADGSQTVLQGERVELWNSRFMGLASNNSSLHNQKPIAVGHSSHLYSLWRGNPILSTHLLRIGHLGLSVTKERRMNEPLQRSDRNLKPLNRMHDKILEGVMSKFSYQHAWFSSCVLLFIIWKAQPYKSNLHPHDFV
jgi:hypothetical protein